MLVSGCFVAEFVRIRAVCEAGFARPGGPKSHDFGYVFALAQLPNALARAAIVAVSCAIVFARTADGHNKIGRLAQSLANFS